MTDHIIGGKGTKIQRVDQMEKSVQAHLNAIAGWFDDPKVTLVVRARGQSLILTNDETSDTIAALLEHDAVGTPDATKVN